MQTRDHLTVQETAERFAVNADTIRRWIKLRRIAATKLGHGRSGYRIPESEVHRLLECGDKAS